jgi:hypothetical protein
MEPIDINRIFGKRYKTEFDPAAYEEPGGKTDLWYCQIPCKYGCIYPYSSDKLAFYCDGYRIKTKIIREHPEIKLLQDGDIEAVFIFPVRQFDILAKYAKPRRKRRLSATHKEKLASSGLPFRFETRTDGSEASSGHRESEISAKGRSSYG